MNVNGITKGIIPASATPKTCQVFKRGSRWFAHLYFSDGSHMPYWQTNWRTKGRMIRNIRCTFAGNIERGVDE